MTSAFWGVFTFGRFCSIWISEYLTNLQMLTIDVLGLLATIVLLLIFPKSMNILWISSCLFGLFQANYFPAVMAFAEEEIQLQGKTVKYIMFCAALGDMAWTFSTGALIPFQIHFFTS